MSSNSTVASTTPASTSATTTTTSLFSSSSSSTTTTTTSPAASSTTTTTTSSPSSSAVSTTTSSTTSPSPTTHVITSIITESNTSGDGSVSATTLTLTTTPSSTVASTTSSSSGSASSSSAASLQNSGSSNGSHGLSTSGKVAIAVVVPVVGVALIILAALFFWRRRKQNKAAEEARRKEVEEYGYNPNTNPTIPALAADTRSEMAEDSSTGYRGWGAGRSSNRNPSTTFSGGHPQASDAGSVPGGFSTSPTAFGGSDGRNSDMYPKQRDTMNSDDLGALGAAPIAANNNRGEMRRGPSNASSSYSAGHRSADDMDQGMGQHHTSDSLGSTQHTYSFNQSSGPYGDGSYGGGDGMPVVRDVSARRNTRIEQGGGYQQGNSGISQNF